MLIKIAKLGASVVEVCLDDTATVADALEAGNIELGTSETVKVNGNAATDSTSVSNGDLITIVPAIKGGAGDRKFVKLARLGSAVREFFIENGHTVADILRMAGDTLGEAEKVKINGADAPMGRVVQDQDLITIVPAIKGGQAA